MIKTEGFDKKSSKSKIRKTIAAVFFFLLFMFAQGAIVVTACIDRYWALWARAGIIWGLVLITLCFFMVRFKSVSILGFRKTQPGSEKRVLFYVPLLLISLLYFVTGFNFGEGPYYAHATLLFTLAIGMAEEIYFRGIICGIWRETGESKAMLISAILFALCHAMNLTGGADLTVTILQICFTFIYGMVFAILYMISKSLVPCVFLHAFHDLCCYLSDGGTIRLSILIAGIQFLILLIYFVCLCKLNGAELNFGVRKEGK